MNLEQVQKYMAINTMIFYIANNLHDVFHLDYDFVYYADENSCAFDHFVPKDKNSLIIPVEDFIDECAVEKYSDDYDDDSLNLRVKSLDKLHKLISFHYSRWLYNHKDVAKEVA